MQIQQMIMAKPMTDPTSWVGAYSELMKEKWDYIIDGFFALDIFLGLRSGYVDAAGNLVTEPRRIRRHYARRYVGAILRAIRRNAHPRVCCKPGRVPHLTAPVLSARHIHTPCTLRPGAHPSLSR